MKKIQESKENYLETILVVEQRQGQVRSIDVANELGFSKPSVSRAMGLLKSLEYIEIDADGFIHLTEEGREKAKFVLGRHLLIKRYLMEILKIDEKIAEEDACHMEHDISEQTFNAMKKVLK